MTLRGKSAIAAALGVAERDLSRYKGPLIGGGIVTKAPEDGAMLLDEARIGDAIAIVKPALRVEERRPPVGDDARRQVILASSTGEGRGENGTTRSVTLLARPQERPGSDGRIVHSAARVDPRRSPRRSSQVAAYTCMEHVLIRHLATELRAFYTGTTPDPFRFLFASLASSDFSISELNPGDRSPLLFVKKRDVAEAARLFLGHRDFSLDAATLEDLATYYSLDSIPRRDADSRGRYAIVNRLLDGLGLSEEDPTFYRARHHLARTCPEYILLREGAIPITYYLDSVNEALREYARGVGLSGVASDTRDGSFYLQVLEHSVREGIVTERTSQRELEGMLRTNYGLEPFATVRLLAYARDLTALMARGGKKCSFDSARGSFLDANPDFRAK